jgi:hypothetical protein
MNKQGIEQGTQFLVQSAKAQMARKNNNINTSKTNVNPNNTADFLTQK